MPELPEVETVVRGLREPLVGRRIESVWYERDKVIQMPSAEQFSARIKGQTVQAITDVPNISCATSTTIYWRFI